VSSSGHLVFFQSLFELKEPPLFFDVMVHLGTLLAVVVYLRRDILDIIQGIRTRLAGEKGNEEGIRLFLLIVLGTVPTGIIGLVFKDWFESLFSQPLTVGIMLLVTGSFLWLTRRAKKNGKKIMKMKAIDSILIGIAQGVAIIPGISRSGATISMALFCGLDRELSGKFSFLLSIPAILGATFLESRKIDSSQEIWPVLIGALVAFGVGYFSLKILMRIIRIGKMANFSYYCWGIGLLMIIFSI
jgi:undecaprenyl-diphosphatase